VGNLKKKLDGSSSMSVIFTRSRGFSCLGHVCLLVCVCIYDDYTSFGACSQVHRVTHRVHRSDCLLSYMLVSLRICLTGS